MGGRLLDDREDLNDVLFEQLEVLGFEVDDAVNDDGADVVVVLVLEEVHVALVGDLSGLGRGGELADRGGAFE